MPPGNVKMINKNIRMRLSSNFYSIIVQHLIYKFQGVTIFVFPELTLIN